MVSIVLKKFVANSVLASRLVPLQLRSRLYRLLGFDVRGRVSFGNFVGPEVHIGAGTYVNADCFFDGPVTVGSGCRVGMGVMFVTSDHEIKGEGRYGPVQIRPIAVGDGCWLGARSVLLPGITVCANTVIGAGAVVTKSIVDPGVYVGVPARLLTRSAAATS